MAVCGSFFLLFILLLSAVTLGIAVTNVIFFHQLRSGDSGSITTGTAHTMFGINLFLAIFSGIMLIWTLIVFFSQSADKLVEDTGTGVATTSAGQEFTSTAASRVEVTPGEAAELSSLQETLIS